MKRSEARESSARNGNLRHRNTHQREIVLQVVRSRCDHPTAEEIFADVKKLDSKIGQATVYRNLNALAELGEINHIRVPSGGADRFDLRTDLHYHIICTECFSVDDVPIPYNEENDWQAERETGYRVNRHRGVFEGLCPKCLKTQTG